MEQLTLIPEEEQRKMFVGMIERELHEYDYGVELGSLVKSAFMKVDRRNFIPARYQDKRFENAVITLNENESSISQPSLVAQMLELADFSGVERALEIGTASGVNAAYMSHLACEVHTIESDDHLAEQAKINLEREGRSNVTVHAGDGLLGVPEEGLFDRIIVTAGAREVPQSLFNQLSLGGKMIIPIGEYPYFQNMYKITKTLDEPEIEEYGRVTFVPLISEEQGGWSRQELREMRSV